MQSKQIYSINIQLNYRSSVTYTIKQNEIMSVEQLYKFETANCMYQHFDNLLTRVFGHCYDQNILKGIQEKLEMILIFFKILLVKKCGIKCLIQSKTLHPLRNFIIKCSYLKQHLHSLSDIQVLTTKLKYTLPGIKS